MWLHTATSLVDKAKKTRSGCPINLATEVLGDRWTMVVLRDIMFGDRRTYRELLRDSLEGIASNILISRLKKLVAEDMLTKASDPAHQQRAVYSLTEKSIALVPLLVQLGAWGVRYMPATPELAIRAQILEEGGPGMWEDFMAELRHHHLGTPLPPNARPVAERLQAAYEELAGRQ